MINSVSINFRFQFDVEYYDLFTNGKFILNGLNSTGKTTILKAIAGAIDSDCTFDFEHMIVDNDNSVAEVSEIIIYLEEGGDLSDIDSVYIDRNTKKEECLSHIEHCSKLLDPLEVSDLLCFFNDKFKKYFPGLLVLVREGKLFISRWEEEQEIINLTDPEAKLLMVFFLLSSKKYFLLLDDFDVGFSISIQAIVLERMMEFVNGNVFDRPFLIATHSPVLVSKYPDNIQNIR